MPSHLAAVLAQLDASREELRAAVDRVPVDRRRDRPAPDRWSVAEVLEHLARVDRLFAARIARAIAEAREAGSAAATGPAETLADGARRRMLDRREPREAPIMAQPTGRVDPERAWEDLERAHGELRAAVEPAQDLALGEIRTEHRTFGTLSVYQWIELTAAHETRHADQIREIAVALAPAG